MIKYMGKIAGSLMIGCLLMGAAQAADLPAAANAQTAQATATEITPRADVIVVKTRYYKGKDQYRRWNETRGYWVDPDWIDAP